MGASTIGGGRQHTILPKFPKNCMKLNGTPPPRDPPMVVTHCISFKQCLKCFKLCSHLQRYSPSCRRPQRSLNIPFTAYGHFSIEKEWYQSRLGSREVSGLLPPANEVWGKVIFSQACVIPSVHEGRGVRRESAHPPVGQNPPGCSPPRQTTLDADPPPRDMSTSGQYASYWNAYLLNIALP